MARRVHTTGTLQSESARAALGDLTRCAFVTPLPDPWYASPRNEIDCLDSKPLAVTIALDAATASALLGAVRQGGPTEADARTALASNVAGAALRFDGHVIEEFCDHTGTMQPTPPLDLTFVDVEEWVRARGPGPGSMLPRHLHLRVSRKLPLSSAVGNAPLVSERFCRR